MRLIEIPPCALIVHHAKFFRVICLALENLVASANKGALKKYYCTLLSLHKKYDFSVADPQTLTIVIKRVEARRRSLGVDEELVTGKDCSLFKTIDYGLFARQKDPNRWGAHGYIRLLKENKSLSYCPYCNCESITPTDAWPALDHYFPHAKFPYLALSLYNLIPCCDICNKPPHKGRDYYPLANNTHPFVDDVHLELKFRTELNRIEDWTNGKESVKFEDAGARARAARHFLGMLNVLGAYNERHRAELADVVWHLHGYSEQYKKDRGQRCPGMLDFLDPRMIGGEMISVDRINAFPMGKLRLDLYEQHVRHA